MSTLNTRAKDEGSATSIVVALLSAITALALVSFTMAMREAIREPEDRQRTSLELPGAAGSVVITPTPAPGDNDGPTPLAISLVTESVEAVTPTLSSVGTPRFGAPSASDVRSRPDRDGGGGGGGGQPAVPGGTEGQEAPLPATDETTADGSEQTDVPAAPDQDTETGGSDDEVEREDKADKAEKKDKADKAEKKDKSAAADDDKVNEEPSSESDGPPSQSDEPSSENGSDNGAGHSSNGEVPPPDAGEEAGGKGNEASSNDG